jgi:hypothetical protein
VAPGFPPLLNLIFLIINTRLNFQVLHTFPFEGVDFLHVLHFVGNKFPTPQKFARTSEIFLVLSKSRPELQPTAS